MKLAVTFFCLTALAVSASDHKTLRNFINKLPSESRLFGVQGGKEINIQERPYTVTIEDTQKHYVGTGALLNNNWLITAAFNVLLFQEKDIIVRYATSKAETGGQTSKVQKIAIHPDYDMWTANLALIKLSKPVKFSKQVKPIFVAATLPKQGEETVVSGYGSTTYTVKTDGILREATIPFIPYKACEPKYKSEKEEFSSMNFCASKPGVGACPLDWGDPLVYNNKLIGIFSGSLGDCGSADYPGVYNDLTQFRRWISEIIKQ